MPASTVSLRPATAADAGFLLRVYAATRADELALTGWDAATCAAFVRMQFQAQDAHYRRHWPAAQQSVLLVQTEAGAEPVGRLWLDRGVHALHVLDIALLPAWRGIGIGSLCLRGLMAEAARRGQTLTVLVEQGNPARHLYARLGFEALGPPQGWHQRMAWRQAPRGPLAGKEACDEQA